MTLCAAVQSSAIKFLLIVIQNHQFQTKRDGIICNILDLELNKVLRLLDVHTAPSALKVGTRLFEFFPTKWQPIQIFESRDDFLSEVFLT